MARRLGRWALVGALVIAAGLVSGAARADIEGDATNAQEGDNSSDTSQGGTASGGDGVAGQVTGVVSSGDTSVDATNSSVGASAEGGGASGANDSSSVTGQNVGTSTTVGTADLLLGTAVNALEGDNDTSLVQEVTASAGDGVAGQVIGVVTSSGGSADIVAANTSDDASGGGGDASGANFASSFVGQDVSTTTLVSTADIDVDSVTNAQEGDNGLEAEQIASSTGGDGVGGQVLGVVAAGDVSMDASNDSTGSSGDGGSADTLNDFASFVGQNVSDTLDVTTADLVVGTSVNALEGDNSSAIAQTADAAAGDGVAGQVAGVVTSAGGSADLVLANTSESSALGGDSSFLNDLEAFTGQSVGSIDV